MKELKWIIDKSGIILNVLLIILYIFGNSKSLNHSPVVLPNFSPKITILWILKGGSIAIISFFQYHSIFSYNPPFQNIYD